MPNPQSTGEVLLAEEQSALTVLHALLTDAETRFPDALADARLPPDQAGFRKHYPDALPRFEAARLASGERPRIARHLATALQEHISWQDASGRRTLREALDEPGEPLALDTHVFGGRTGWQPGLVYRGQRWDATRLAEFGGQLAGRGMMTRAADDALTWVSEHVLESGVLRLSGRKIAMLGAGAEMAPTRHWLACGADVLWLDTEPPPGDWPQSQELSGRLYWPVGNVDLLTDPRAVLATLIAFADGTPLDIGLYAYAPGRARELRLTATMNALVNALPAELIASVTMLVSPTTPASLGAQDVAAVRARRDARPVWEAACERVGLLGRGPGSVTLGDASATRSVVAIQGASYQAAQYLGKTIMADCWATHGQTGSPDLAPLRVSANTAAITRTRSLAHPVFTAAFGGAAAFGVETLAPRQSRCINGLLAVHDWLHPETPQPGIVRVHGGIHTLPYPLEPALRVAAGLGFVRSPRLLRGFFRK